MDVFVLEFRGSGFTPSAFIQSSSSHTIYYVSIIDKLVARCDEI
jgi:hypothetical protein